MYDLIYEGNEPPSNMSGAAIRQVDDPELETMFTAGRLADDNYNIIIQDGTTRRFWYPTPPAPETPPVPAPVALTKQQFVDLLAANNGSLTDTLNNWP